MKEIITDDSIIIECEGYSQEFGGYDSRDFLGVYTNHFGGYDSRDFLGVYTNHLNMKFALENGEMSIDLIGAEILYNNINRHISIGKKRPSKFKIEIPIISSEEIRLEKELKLEIERTKSSIENLKTRLRQLEILYGKRDMYGKNRV